MQLKIYFSVLSSIFFFGLEMDLRRGESTNWWLSWHPVGEEEGVKLDPSRLFPRFTPGIPWNLTASYRVKSIFITTTTTILILRALLSSFIRTLLFTQPANLTCICDIPVLFSLTVPTSLYRIRTDLLKDAQFCRNCDPPESHSTSTQMCLVSQSISISWSTAAKNSNQYNSNI